MRLVRLLKWLGRGVLAVLLLTIIAFGLMYIYFTFFNHIGERVKSVVMAHVHARHEHYLTYAQIPLVFRNAMIATEDRRFYTDPGIDPIGIARSFVVDVEKDGYVEGGSTITQQLVDNSILGKQKTLHRKILQAFYAVGLYDTLSKPETFALYTNAIYFGHGAYGLYAAAETYFGKPPARLTAGELTLLAGLPNAPSIYDPYKDMKLARKRQSIVLENMEDDGKISKAEAVRIFQEPIRLK